MQFGNQLSLSDLSPLANIPKDHLLVAFKAFFDGGNEADSTQYDIVTLAALAGDAIHWRNFERQWNKQLIKHGAPWLHTTDAVGLTGVFSKRKGWNETNVEKFIEDCVTVIERCATVRTGKEATYRGLRPITITVLLKDFKRAVQALPELGTVEHLCAIQSAGFVFGYGLHCGSTRFQLFFDQGEHFYGHIKDRISNPKSLRTGLGWNLVTHLGESNMRDVPGLQACDVLAWAVNHEFEDGVIRFDWQRRLLAIDRDKEWYDYAALQNPIRENIKTVQSYKLPRRRPVR
jgi:hypothetical protein